MKKVTEAVLTGIAKISKETAKKDANSACTFLMYEIFTNRGIGSATDTGDG